LCRLFAEGKERLLSGVDQPLIPQHETGKEEKGAQKGAAELFVHGGCSYRKE
jgi:hypothetical protein